MYSEINTHFRTKMNNATFLYNGNALPLIWESDVDGFDGAYIRMALNTNQPSSSEVGYAGAEEVTGFYQVGFFVPASDKGIDFSLNNLADQLRVEFRRQSIVDGDLKVEYLDVERNTPLRIDGMYSCTCRINFRIFAC